MLFTVGLVSVDHDINMIYPGNRKRQIEKNITDLEEIWGQSELDLSNIVKIVYQTLMIRLKKQVEAQLLP